MNEASPPPASLAGLLSLRVVRLFHTMRRAMVLRQRRDFGLSEIEWRIMTMLSGDQQISLNGLADMLLQDRGQLSRTVKSMVERGLLTRERPQGGPQIAIGLSPPGKELRVQMEHRAVERDLFLTQGIAPEDLAAAGRAIDRMIQRAGLLLDDAPQTGSLQAESCDMDEAELSGRGWK